MSNRRTHNSRRNLRQYDVMFVATVAKPTAEDVEAAELRIDERLRSIGRHDLADARKARREQKAVTA